jgi:signal transduction histidine kinase
MLPDRAVIKASWQSWISSGFARTGPYWLQWVWTFLFCAALAVGFTVLGFLAFARDSAGAWRNVAGWAEWYGRNLIVCLTIGGLIHIAFDILGQLIGGQAAVRRWRPWQRTLFFSGVPLLCVAVGWPLGVWLAGADLGQWVSTVQGSNVVFGSILLSALMTFLFHQFFSLKSRQIEAERQAAEAQLRLLQGQIEPHFLFNTLANVQALMDEDLPRARQMLGAFTDYLRASLSQLRREDTTLGQELDLAEAYLRLLQGRMDDRLRYRIEADDAARRVLLPPLLLQPLIENAVGHGLEPLVQGGTVSVRAALRGAELVVEVHDDGRGLHAAARPGPRRGSGMALGNIRSRLLSRYGDGASLTLAAAEPGTQAVLRLPVEPAPSLQASPEGEPR